MTISQGECPRGTCPEESSRVNRSKPVIPQWFSPIWLAKAARVCRSTTGRPTVNVPNSGLECRGVHRVVGDLKAEYHSVNDPTGDRALAEIVEG